jgi:hypothetical protein
MDAEAHSKIEAEVAHASSQIAKLERVRDEYKKLVRLVDSDDGALVNTVFVSLLASARLHGIEPRPAVRHPPRGPATASWNSPPPLEADPQPLAYLRDLLCVIPRMAPPPPPGTRPRVLEADPRAARNSAEAGCQRLPRVLLSPPS